VEREIKGRVVEGGGIPVSGGKGERGGERGGIPVTRVEFGRKTQALKRKVLRKKDLALPIEGKETTAKRGRGQGVRKIGKKRGGKLSDGFISQSSGRDRRKTEGKRRGSFLLQKRLFLNLHPQPTFRRARGNRHLRRIDQVSN